MTERQRIKKYATVIEMWTAKFNTAEIAEHTGLEECVVARWIWSYREVVRAA